MFSKENNIAELSPRDVLDFAVKIEGKVFNLYNAISNYVQESKTKELFTIFADEEIKHKEVFQKMILNSGKEIYELTSIPQNIEFLSVKITSTVFSKDLLFEKIKRIKNVETAFEFLISMELDQIFFYSEIRESLEEKHRSVIDDIIAIKRRHFVRVMQIKQMKNY